MSWNVVFHDQFAIEFEQLKVGVQDELLAHAVLLRDYGPSLGRPTVDTLKGSKHANMKEMRFSHGKDVWRVAFAFDPRAKRCSWWRAIKLARINGCFTND